MARRKAVTFLVIEKLTKKLPVTLDPEEREALKDRENELGERVLTLERAHEAASNYAKELSRARKERIEDARAAWAETMDERISGTAQREFKCDDRPYRLARRRRRPGTRDPALGATIRRFRTVRTSAFHAAAAARRRENEASAAALDAEAAGQAAAYEAEADARNAADAAAHERMMGREVP